MSFQAKYPGRCKKCGLPINIGDQINWSRRGERGVRHQACMPEAKSESTWDSRPDAVVLPPLPRQTEPIPTKSKVEAETRATKLAPWALAEKLMDTGIHTCLWGPPSIGKTYLAQSRPKFYSITCNDQMQISEIIGHVWPDGDKWVWKDGPATLAFRNGTPLILNELGLCNPEVLDVMLCLLDSAESAVLTLPTGETLRAAPGYVCVATSNHNPDETLSEALRTRLICLELKKPHPQLLKRIEKGSPQLAALVDKSFESGQAQISCRAALTFLKLRETFHPEQAATLCFGSRGKDILAMLPTVKPMVMGAEA